jgi:hypothetical protein
MVRIDVDNVLPTRPGSCQGLLHVPKRLSNLVRKQFWNLQIVISTALTGCLHAIADFYRLRVMQFIQQVFPIARGNKKLGLIHGVPCQESKPGKSFHYFFSGEAYSLYQTRTH